MLAALGFLTIFGSARPPSSATVRWFPLVGAAVGAVVGLVWWAASRAWRGPMVPAALAIATDVVLTGMLHLDGLADSADGLLPHLDRERRLRVMSTPDVGAFGLVTTVAVLLLRFAAFGSQHPDVALVVALWCVSRSLMVVVVLLVPYARPEGGLASAFLGSTSPVTIAVASVGLVAGGVLAGWAGGTSAVVGVGVGVAAAGVLLWSARRRLGGFTGDVLGATVVVSETVALLVAGVHW